MASCSPPSPRWPTSSCSSEERPMTDDRRDVKTSQHPLFEDVYIADVGENEDTMFSKLSEALGHAVDEQVLKQVHTMMEKGVTTDASLSIVASVYGIVSLRLFQTAYKYRDYDSGDAIDKAEEAVFALVQENASCMREKMGVEKKRPN